MKQSKAELKIGITVLVAIASLIFGILWGKQVTLSGGVQTVMARFTDIAGLEVGAPVLVNGIRKGKVDRLQLEQMGVIVLMTLKETVSLYDDAQFEIASPELMGGKVINIFPGISGDTPSQDYIFTGKPGGGMNELMKMSSDLVTDVQRLLKALEITIENINKTAGDPRLQEAFLSSMENLDESTERAKILIADNEEKMNQLMSNLVTSTETLQNILENQSGNINNVMDDFGQFATKLNSAADRLNGLIVKIEGGEGTLGTLINDGELAQSLQQTITDLDSLVVQIKEEGIQTNISLFGRKKKQ